MGEGEAAFPAKPEGVFFFFFHFLRQKRKRMQAFLFPSRFCLLKEDVQSSLGELLSWKQALPAGSASLSMKFFFH